jgi:ATP-binding cassette subfamily B protein
MRNARAVAGVLALAWRSSRRQSLTLILLMGLSVVSSGLMAVALKLLVDAAAGQDEGAALAGAVVGALGVSSAVAFLPLGGIVSLSLQEKVSAAFDQQLIERVAAVPTLEVQSAAEFASTLHLLTEQDRYAVREALPACANGASSALLVVATAVFLAAQRPVLGLVPLVLLPLLVSDWHAYNLLRNAWRGAATEGRLANEVFRIATTPDAGKELRVFGSGAELLRRHAAASHVMLQARRRAAFRGTALTLITRVVLGIVYGVTVLTAANRAARGQATPGDVVLVVVLTLAVISMSGGLIGSLSSLSRLAAAGQRLDWLHQQADSARTYARAVPDRLSSGLRLEQVELRYPGSARAALTGVDVDLPAGAVIALVGDNGAGKSSLVQLLCGLRHPTSGRVLVDGVDLRELEPVAFRARISATFQDFLSLELVAAESVGLGDLPRASHEQARATAAANAGATELIAGLPDGWQTSLGTTWADGQALSLGQWQKVALSRGLMRDDPLLVVLDEPTSALDPLAEQRLLEHFSSVAHRARSAGAVTLIVSHWFSTVRLADRILVLEDGRLVESGTHADLMARPALYAQLYSLQADSYQ